MLPAPAARRIHPSPIRQDCRTQFGYISRAEEGGGRKLRFNGWETSLRFPWIDSARYGTRCIPSSANFTTPR
jgi:hypothetical protein